MHYKKTTFKNGLRLITVPMKDTKTVTVIIACATGSKHEDKNNNGISHFLEHMFFKGTKKRPKTKDISSALDSVGGEFNAFTDKEETAYYAKVDAAHLDLSLDVISDIFLNSKIESKEIEKERGVILQEINMYLDTPMRYVGDIFEHLLYGDQPAGWEVIGSKKNILRMKRNDFVKYLKSRYSAKNTVVCVAGNLDQDIVRKKVEKIFHKMNSSVTSEKPRVIEEQSEPQLKIMQKKTDQVHLVLGVRAYDMFHPDRFVLSLIANILGGSMSSRLFLSVRERLGLAYYVRAVYENYTDTGYLAVSAGVDTDKEKIEKTVMTIMKELQQLLKKRVDQAEIKKSKDNIRGRTALSFESSDEVASYLVGQEALRGKIMLPEEILAEIDKVTPDDILRVAQDIFRNDRLNFAAIGPIKEDAYLRELLVF